MRKALFAGSFDPITSGHLEIVQRALPLFDEILVAIGVNPNKKSFFPLQDRLDMLESTFADIPEVSVHQYQGLTIDFAQKHGVRFLLRGLRNGEDLAYERNVDLINERLGSKMETVFLLSEVGQTHISSSLIRQIVMYGGDVSGLVPDAILPVVQRYKDANA